MARMGITGRKASAVAPADGGGRGRQPAIAIADVLGVPIYVVHVSCIEAADAIARAGRAASASTASAGRPFDD
ncbi:hypothetical protein ACFODQ_04780 [Comamonas sp. JC664]